MNKFSVKKIINYNKYLKNLDVKKIKNKTGFSYALEFLYQHMQKQVNIAEIKIYVESKGIKLQISYLGQQYGYNILKGGDKFKDIKIKKSHYMLVDLENTYNGYIKDKRKEKITEELWIKIKKEYDNKCINCGSIEGEPMRWNKNKITELSQGHMNPTKILTFDNVIPQCSICNQQYKNKTIFNKR